jgi:NifU-like protein
MAGSVAKVPALDQCWHLFLWSNEMGWEYSEKTKQLFMDAVHGKPGTHLGEIENPDGIGEHGSIACGDSMRFTFRVKRHPTDPIQDVITEAKYLTFGCTSAIASSEALCEIIEGGSYTPIAALKIQNRDIVDFLQGLPEQKIHCSVMGAEALESAVFNWAQRRGIDLKKLGVDMHDQETEEGRIVCKCFSITEPYLKRKIRELNLRTIPQITNAIKAGGGCSSCHHVPGGLQDLLDQIWGGQSGAATGLVQIQTTPEEPRDVAELSPFQFAKKIEKVIDEYVRPSLRMDGGDVEVVDIKGTVVYCSLKGACSGCAGASLTLKMMVERALKEEVDDRIHVIEV